MTTELAVPTTYDEIGLSNLLGKLSVVDDLSYQVLGLTNLLDRLETTTKKITAFNIDDLLEDKSILESKIKKNYIDLEGYAYLYLDRDTKTLHLGVEDAGYSFALKSGSSTPVLTINPNGKVGINDTDYFFDFSIKGSLGVTNVGTPSLEIGTPTTIMTGSPNTKGLVVRGTQYSATAASRVVALGIRSGAGDSLAYSDNEIAWTGLGITTFGNAGYCSVWDGGKYVAVGQSINSIAYSYNGATWTGLGTSIFSTGGYGIAWNGSRFVAVGEGTNSIAYSSDGITWTGLGLTVFTTSGNKVAWNGTMFVAVGSGTLNNMAYSYDGITWTGLGLLNGLAYINYIFTNGDYWLASSEIGGHVFYSLNGIDWTYLGVAFTGILRAAAWNGTYWLGGGTDATTSARIKISTDGIVWNSVNLTGTVFTHASAAVHTIIWDGTTWVAGGINSTGGTAGMLAYSTDGSTWANGTGVVTTSIVYDLCPQKEPYSIPETTGVPQTPTNQTANLQEWQEYDGDVLAYIDYAGRASFPYKVTAVTTTYVALASDMVIYGNSAIAFTITLPAASGSGKEYFIKNINTGTITIEGDSSDTIDGDANQALIQWEGVHLIDYAANAWIVV